MAHQKYTNAVVLLWITTIAPAVPNERLGCYVDGYFYNRILPHEYEELSTITVAKCKQACKGANYTYAGVEYSSECWCGNSHTFPRHGKASDDECNMPCNGNETQTCGGSHRIEVYAVCPRGTFYSPASSGNCGSNCYCNTSHICIYSTGKCPYGCQEGWTGDNCSQEAYSMSTDVQDGTSSLPPSATLTPAGDIESGRGRAALVYAITAAIVSILIVFIVVCSYRHSAASKRRSKRPQPQTVLNDPYSAVNPRTLPSPRYPLVVDHVITEGDGDDIVDNSLYGGSQEVSSHHTNTSELHRTLNSYSLNEGETSAVVYQSRGTDMIDNDFYGSGNNI